MHRFTDQRGVFFSGHFTGAGGHAAAQVMVEAGAFFADIAGENAAACFQPEGLADGVDCAAGGNASGIGAEVAVCVSGGAGYGFEQVTLI